MNNACVYFHQGWTDIIVCLSLINYYSKRYDEITLITRSDSKEIIEFYIKPLNNIKVIYINKLNFKNSFENNNNNEVEYINEIIKIPSNFNKLFHGVHDIYRNDEFNSYWYRSNKKEVSYFSEAFYSYYDIDFNIRILEFNLIRDLVLENIIYNNFINEHGKDYIIYHDNNDNNEFTPTKIEFNNKLDNINYVNLKNKSNLFFDYIKVLLHSKEIHLIDSSWAAICYQLDSKYNLFKDKKIYIYCQRGHYNLFTYPIKLENWILI